MGKSPKTCLPNLSTDIQENTTFETKKQQPKFNFRTMDIKEWSETLPGEGDGIADQM